MAKVKVNVKTEKIVKQMSHEVERGLTAAAIFVEGEAKVRAAVDTGNLRSSITHDVGTTRASIGTNVHYAPYLEYGTVRSSAQPFLLPALMDNRQRIYKIFAEYTGKAVR